MKIHLNIRRKYLNLIYLSLILSVIACSEKCPEKVDVGKFSLSENSKQLFPYQNGEKRLIFKDSLNNKLVFEIINGGQNGFIESRWDEDCKEDSLKSKQIEVTASIEYKSLRLKPSTDNLGFDIWIKQEVEVDASDLSDIKEIDGFQIYRSNVGNFSYITDNKNSSPERLPSEMVAEIMINGKLYKNLLKSSSINSGDLYYSLDKGIVAINEKYGRFEKPKFWTLDQVLYQ